MQLRSSWLTHSKQICSTSKHVKLRQTSAELTSVFAFDAGAAPALGFGVHATCASTAISSGPGRPGSALRSLPSSSVDSGARAGGGGTDAAAGSATGGGTNSGICGSFGCFAFLGILLTLNYARARFMPDSNAGLSGLRGGCLLPPSRRCLCCTWLKQLYRCANRFKAVK